MQQTPTVSVSEAIPEFGLKRENEERRDGGCGIVFDPETQMFAVGKQLTDNLYRLFSGGVDANEDLKEGILREVLEESGLYDFHYAENIGQAFTHYYNNLRNVNRVGLATCYLIILKTKSLKLVQLEDHEKFSLAWITADELLNNWKSRNQNNDYDHWIYFMERGLSRLRKLEYLK